MEVYRIEHGETGRGPYFSQEGVMSELDNATGRKWREPSNIHPHPADEWGWEFVDDEIMVYGRWLFGFLNFEQYMDWFYSPKIRNILKKYGYVLKVYKVGGWHVKKTARQVIFKKEKSECVRTLCPLTMEKM